MRFENVFRPNSFSLHKKNSNNNKYLLSKFQINASLQNTRYLLIFFFCVFQACGGKHEASAECESRAAGGTKQTNKQQQKKIMLRVRLVLASARLIMKNRKADACSAGYINASSTRSSFNQRKRIRFRGIGICFTRPDRLYLVILA